MDSTSLMRRTVANVEISYIRLTFNHLRDRPRFDFDHRQQLQRVKRAAFKFAPNQKEMLPFLAVGRSSALKKGIHFRVINERREVTEMHLHFYISQLKRRYSSSKFSLENCISVSLVAKQIELLDMSITIERQTRSGLVLQSLGGSAALVSSEPSMAPDESFPNYCPSKGISAAEAFPPGFEPSAEHISADDDLKSVSSKSSKIFPWREISATRGFPAGCGRNAERVSSQNHLKLVSAEKGNSLGYGKTMSEPRPSDSNGVISAGEKVHDGYACRDSLKGALNRSCKQVIQVAKYNSSGTTGIDVKKHKLMDWGNSISVPIENKYITESSGGLTTEKKVPPKGKVSYLDSSQLVARGGLVLQLLGGSSALVSSERSMALDKSSTNYCSSRGISAAEAFPPGFEPSAQHISADDDLKSVSSKRSAKNFPWREISATRGFPPGCGRDAERSIDKQNPLKLVSAEKGNSLAYGRTISEPRPSDRNGVNTAREKVQDGYACRHSLMGASNCSFKEGIQVAKYNSSGPTGIYEKKRKLMDVRNSLPAPIEKKHKTENSGGLAAEKKVPPKGKVAYFDPGQLFGGYKNYVDAGHCKEDENVTTGCKAVVSHDRAIKALNLFRNILKEEGKKLKEHGNPTHRIDLLAYEQLKKIHMWSKPGIAILGSIPGVTVGDKFQYRVELLIVGLHRPLESGIDYLNRSGKIIATSVVASGGYENDLSDPDVLIYSGQGSKPRGKDKQPKDQKLKGGNLALKNSFDEKNFVRVIIRGMIVSSYVYNGFYLVEKYWRKRGNQGNLIFKFQLRRVADQPKLHFRKN